MLPESVDCLCELLFVKVVVMIHRNVMKRGRKTQQENFKKREKEENEKDTIDRTESKVLPLLFIIE